MKHRRPLELIAAVILLGFAAHAAGQPAPDAPSGGGGATLAPSQRDPFWPVDYLPPEQRVEASVPLPEVSDDGPLEFSNLSPEEQAIIKSRLRVGGILQTQKDQSIIAIINGQVTLEGDILQVNVQGKLYRFLVKSLTKSKITLEPAPEEDAPPPK